LWRILRKISINAPLYVFPQTKKNLQGFQNQRYIGYFYVPEREKERERERERKSVSNRERARLRATKGKGKERERES
jgi:G:T/U-mismatch repair DNA glycosylase